MGLAHAADASRFVAALERVLGRPRLHPSRIVADFRALTWVDADAFTTVRDHLRRNNPAIAALRFRQAVLRPDGLAGSVVAGFYAVAPQAQESRSFSDVGRALAWLGAEEAQEDFAAVERIRLDRAGDDAGVGRLRTLLDARRGDLSLREAAKALAVSARSLQRSLQAAGTSFREQQNEARLRHAKHLLATDAKLVAIAHDLGFASPQHFATWFRQQAGASPSAWRARNR